jgi:hypothetical protein
MLIQRRTHERWEWWFAKVHLQIIPHTSHEFCTSPLPPSISHPLDLHHVAHIEIFIICTEGLVFSFHLICSQLKKRFFLREPTVWCASVYVPRPAGPSPTVLQVPLSGCVYHRARVCYKESVVAAVELTRLVQNQSSRFQLTSWPLDSQPSSLPGKLGARERREPCSGEGRAEGRRRPARRAPLPASAPAAAAPPSSRTPGRRSPSPSSSRS